MKDWGDWDRTLEPGDLCTSYYKGYWRVVKIERRFYDNEHRIGTFRREEGAKVGDEYNPTIHVEPVLSASGKPKKGGNKSCDASYVRRLDPAGIKKMRDEEIQAANDKYELLMDHA